MLIQPIINAEILTDWKAPRHSLDLPSERKNYFNYLKNQLGGSMEHLYLLKQKLVFQTGGPLDG